MHFTLICLLLFKNVHLFCHIPSAWLCLQGRVMMYSIAASSVWQTFTQAPFISTVGNVGDGRWYTTALLQCLYQVSTLACFHHFLLAFWVEVVVNEISEKSRCVWGSCQAKQEEYLSCDLRLWDLRILLLSIPATFRFCEKNSNQSMAVL